MRTARAARYTALLLSLSVVIVGISILALLAQPRNIVSLIYPAAGLVFAAIWVRGLRFFPVVLIVHFILSYHASRSVTVALCVAAIELAVCAAMYRTLVRYNVNKQLARFRDVWLFVASSLVITGLGGVAAVVGEMIIEKHSAVQVASDALAYWLSDFVSILIFTPLVMTWRRWPFSSRQNFERWLLLSLILVAFGAGIALLGASASTALFLLLPIVVFTSIVAGVAGAASSGAILLVVLLVLQQGGSPVGFEPLLRTLFVGIAAATGYLLGVLWSGKEEDAVRFHYMARHDSLTGLFNRFELETQLAQAVSKSAPLSHALLYLDLDQFKLVNDTCGHLAGDRMLQELSLVLQQAVTTDAPLARLGGDEFACILHHSSEEAAKTTIAALHEAMARYRFHVDNLSFGIGASIGITFFPAAGGDTADAVLGRADVACYRAKDDGRNRTHVYLPGDEAMLQWHSALQKASQLEMALSSGQFQLYAQKIVDLQRGDGERQMYEVLLRLVDNGEVRSAADFLPTAERFGLMMKLDRWVLDTACQRLAALRDPRVSLSVNISGATLNDPSFYPHIVSIPGRFGLLPSQLCLEVTEGVMIHRLRQAVEAMRGLRALGFDIALDDFGAGVASFAYLQELPVNYVKLDGRFVRDLGTDPASEVIVESLVRLANIRGIECVAEWVENETTLLRLKSMGVRYAQGYHLGVPIALDLALSGGAENRSGEIAQAPRVSELPLG